MDEIQTFASRTSKLYANLFCKSGFEFYKEWRNGFFSLVENYDEYQITYPEELERVLLLIKETQIVHPNYVDNLLICILLFQKDREKFKYYLPIIDYHIKPSAKAEHFSYSDYSLAAYFAHILVKYHNASAKAGCLVAASVFRRSFKKVHGQYTKLKPYFDDQINEEGMEFFISMAMFGRFLFLNVDWDNIRKPATNITVGKETFYQTLNTLFIYRENFINKIYPKLPSLDDDECPALFKKFDREIPEIRDVIEYGQTAGHSEDLRALALSMMYSTYKLVPDIVQDEDLAEKCIQALKKQKDSPPPQN